MTSALLTHREGIAPYWVGDQDPGFDPDLVMAGRTAAQKLDTLGRIPREVVIDDRLFPRFSVVGDDLKCELIGGNQKLVTLKRPDNSYFAGTQLPMVRDAADLRSDRNDEILMQTEDIQSFFASVLLLDGARSKWVYELMEAAVRLCGYIEFPFKFDFDVPRPSTFSSKVMPMIDTPTHGAWPAGHATEAYALATILAGMVDRKAGGTARFDMNAATADINAPARVLMRTAMRISDNRTIAGVHYPHDSICGAVLGVTIGEALINWLSGANKTAVRTLVKADAGTGPHDLTEDSIRTVLGAAPTTRNISAAVDDVSQHLWNKALGEIPEKP